MNFQFYLEKLQNSKEFEIFLRENPSAFLCSAFFSIDKKGNDNKQHFDYFISEKSKSDVYFNTDSETDSVNVLDNNKVNNKDILNNDFSSGNSENREIQSNEFTNSNENKLKSKIFSFQLENNFKKVELENYNKIKLFPLSQNYDFNLEDIEKIILDKMKEENIKKEIQKILLSLQNVKSEDFIIGTIFISGMGMLKIKINLKNMKITEFEKNSIFDIMKIIKGNK